MRKIWIALLVMVPCLFARGDEKNCKEVSGGVVTNFLTESGTVNFPNESNKLFVFTTLGTATGDLAGGIGVYIFSFTPGNPAVANVHHHWVTEAGDTIFAQDATATPRIRLALSLAFTQLQMIATLSRSLGELDASPGQREN
jgi:hypothetical protein